MVTARIVWVGVRRNIPKPIVEYDYRVNGVQYHGSRIAFAFGNVYSRDEAEELVQRFAAGSQAAVYYDPDRPHESTLEQKHHGLGSGLLVNAVLLFSPTAFCLCVGLFGLAEALKK